MALSEIIINDEIQYQTSIAITTSNYQDLRQFILKREPIPSVIKPIMERLAEHCAADKQMIINTLTQEACESQKQMDLQDAKSDQQERINDDSLKSNYDLELPALENRITLLGMRCAHQQSVLNQALSQLNEYKINRDQINRSLEGIRMERQLLNSRYPYNPRVLPGNVHVHTPQTIPFATIPSNPVYIYTAEDQLAWDRLYHEENRLLADKLRVTNSISLKETECSREEESLNTSLQEKKETEERLKKIRHQLEIALPENERQRQIRREERTARENARQGYDHHLNQLSHSKHQELKRRIASKFEEIDSKLNQLKHKAEEESYPVYISQLGQALDRTDGPQIGFAEREALKSILSMMNYYLEMEGKESVMKLSLQNEQDKLLKLKQIQADNDKKVDHYSTSNIKLEQDNKKLAEQNIQLAADSMSAGTIRNSALYISLFGGTGSLLAIGLVTTLTLNPIFFAIPAALGLITLVSLGVSLVYHFKKSSNEGQVILNKETISNNESTITDQKKMCEEMVIKTLPNLNLQIAESGKTIVAIEQQLKAHQKEMDNLLKKAHNVTNINFTNTYGGGYFFNNTNETADYKPSAPPPYNPDYTPLYPSLN